VVDFDIGFVVPTGGLAPTGRINIVKMSNTDAPEGYFCCILRLLGE
jgi:hypothetical protein